MARKNENTDLGLMMEIMEPDSNALSGKTFSITGHLGRPRNEIVKLIKEAGGSFEKTPTYFTNYLITNNDWNKGSTVADGTSRKLLKAQRNGTKIISESEFYDMLMSKPSSD